MCETLRITQQIIRICLYLIDTKNYQRMMILKTRVIPDDVKPMKAAEPNKTNFGKRNNSDTRKKSTNPKSHHHKKLSNM